MGVLARCLLAVVLTLCVSQTAGAVGSLPERYLGKADAPIRVDEFVSFTCSHCADFYASVLPVLQEKYIDTGKVKFVFHEYPLDGISLKAAAVARCMPEDAYLPFAKTLFATMRSWAFDGGSAEEKVIQYAKLGGLSAEKAKACANDAGLQNAIIADRTMAAEKYNVAATPTFVVNEGAEIISGAQSIDAFSAVFDRLLAAKKK